MNSGYDDSSWRTVDVPHDWSIELNPTTTGTQCGTGFLQGGLGWYRKHFTIAPADAGKQISVEFDGVYMDSYVYLNGTLIGNHPFGYTHANYDLANAKAADGTPLLKTDGSDNVLAVKVQNKQPSSRWYSGSGIYRNVHLIVTDPIHIARYGTQVTTPDLENTYTTGNYATVHVNTTLQNQSGASQPVGVLSKIMDAAGNVVASSQSIADGRGQRRRRRRGHPPRQPEAVVDGHAEPLHAAHRPDDGRQRRSTRPTPASACAGSRSTRTTA